MDKFSLKKNAKEAMSLYENYCDGYKSPAPNGKGYFVSPVLTVGKVSEKFYHPGSRILDSILAYDKAETTSAYLGQINMTNVSSFVGVNGVIWGYDVVKPEDLKKSYVQAWKSLDRDGKEVSVYDIAPLQRASEELWGRVEKKHFPFLPGAHVPCAGRYFIKEGPTEIYGAMAMGIPEDRAKQAVLIMEDTGEVKGIGRKELQKKVTKDISKSVLDIGRIQNIKYKEIFVGFQSISLDSDEIGCALVVMPYFYLAKKAYPGGRKDLFDTSLAEWKNKVKTCFLDS